MGWGNKDCIDGSQNELKILPRSHISCIEFYITSMMVKLWRIVSAVDADFLFSDENECYILKPCKHDGICINNNGSYVCNCTKGWQGHDCEEGKE